MNVICGVVRDVESGIPVQNVTIYIAYSSIGTSSGIDGRFRIAKFPHGKYDVVFLRVGYETQTLSVLAKNDDSLYFDIKLKAKPVEAKEVEILGYRENEPNVQPFFFPHDTTDVLCVYGAASSFPIGILSADSAIYLYAMESAIIDSQKYVRLWLLYKNLSCVEREFDPTNCLRLIMTNDRGPVRTIVPANPSMMLNKVSKKEAMELITSVFNKSLASLATKQSMITYYQETNFELLLILDQLLHANRTRESLAPKSFEPALTGSLTASMYTAYTTSVNVGILGTFIVYPQNSLNGYVYFPFPGMGWKTGGKTFAESMHYRYRLVIKTPTGERAIDFISQ